MDTCGVCGGNGTTCVPFAERLRILECDGKDCLVYLVYELYANDLFLQSPEEIGIVPDQLLVCGTLV